MILSKRLKIPPLLVDTKYAKLYWFFFFFFFEKQVILVLELYIYIYIKVQRDRNLKILQNLLPQVEEVYGTKSDQKIKCPFYIYFSNTHTSSMMPELSIIVNLCCDDPLTVKTYHL